MVYEVESLDDFNKQLKEAGDKLVVVDFTATWCGPCKMIGPYFVELASKYPNVIFLKVDVDEAEDVSSEYQINCMPTFLFFRNQKKVDEFAGANREKLLEMLMKYL